MTQHMLISRIGPAFLIRTVVISYLTVLLTGCSTVVTYHANLPAGPARPAGYPIPVYTENMTVPRPCELIGTVTVAEGFFTMRGGSADEETKKIIETAWKKGADVVHISSIETPGFSRAAFRMEADLLRYADDWETIPVSTQKLVTYFDMNAPRLDPIEGVWEGAGTNPNHIVIIQDHYKPGRDFVGLILSPDNPTWREGYKKMDIKRGVQPGAYILDYYLEDFSRVEVTVILGHSQVFTLNMPTSEEEADFVTYSKIR
jgi:hypothetical protein